MLFFVPVRCHIPDVTILTFLLWSLSEALMDAFVSIGIDIDQLSYFMGKESAIT